METQRRRRLDGAQRACLQEVGEGLLDWAARPDGWRKAVGEDLDRLRGCCPHKEFELRM